MAKLVAGIDGIIISTTECNNALLQEMNAKTPIVVVARDVPGLQRAVGIDNAKGVHLAVDYLVGLGHREIAMLTLPYNTVNRTPRQARVAARRERPLSKATMRAPR